MYRKLVLAALTCTLIVGCNGSKPGKELLTVNGKTITEGDLNFLGSINPRIKAQLGNPTGRKQIIDNMVEQELFYQAALKKGLDRDATVKDKADLYRRVIIAQAYVEKQLEDDAKKTYDDNKSDFEKLRMSHILLKTKAPDQPAGAPGHTDAEALALADKVKERLDNKEEFATVAKDVTEDTLTKSNGGDLGEVSKTEPRMVRRGYEPLVEKAFSMKVGEVSAPIKAQDGYHIIVVSRGVEVEPFDAAKQGIMVKMQGDIRNKLLAELKKQAKINYADSSIKPPDDAMPTPSAQEPAAPAAAQPPAAPGTAPAAPAAAPPVAPAPAADQPATVKTTVPLVPTPPAQKTP